MDGWISDVLRSQFELYKNLNRTYFKQVAKKEMQTLLKQQTVQPKNGKPMFDHMKVRILARPEIPTDHLMSDFDQFYSKVVSRQLQKDKMQTKQKYANCTAFGEGEKDRDQQQQLQQENLSQQQMIQSARISDMDILMNYNSCNVTAAPFNNTMTLASPACLPDGIESNSYDQDLPEQVIYEYEANGRISRAHSQGGYNSRDHAAKGSRTNYLTANLRTQKSHLLHENKPGSGIAHYIQPQTQALIKSTQRRQKSSRLGYSNRAFLIQSAQQANFAQTLTEQDGHNRILGKQKEQKQELLNKMLSDDEEYRQRLLKGFYNKHKTTTQQQHFCATEQTSPLRNVVAPQEIEETTNQRQNNSRVIKKGGKRNPRMAPNLLTQIDKVQQIYSQGQNSAHGEIIDLATMHTSEANQATRRFELTQNQWAIPEDEDQFSIQQTTTDHPNQSDYATRLNIAKNSNKPPTARSTPHNTTARRRIQNRFKVSQQPQRQHQFQMQQQRNGHNIVNVREGGEQQVIKSLEVGEIFKGVEDMTMDGDSTDFNNYQARVKPRPMTGAAMVGGVKKHTFPPFSGKKGGPSQYNTHKFGCQSNRLSSSKEFITTTNNTLQTMTRFDQSRLNSGNVNGDYSVGHQNPNIMRNLSSAHFQTGYNSRQSQQALVMNSLLHMNAKNMMNQRAKSSTNNNKHRIMPKAAGQNRDSDLLNQSRSGSYNVKNYMSATALSQIPPKTNVQVLDDYYSQYNTVGQIGSIKFTTEFERLSDKIEKFWKLKETPRSETKKVSTVLNQMQVQGESHQCPEFTKFNMLQALTDYLRMMKDYYETEVQIRNVFQEREKSVNELILLSKKYDQVSFKAHGISLVLKLRMLTVQLVYAVKRWKEMVQRATATFTNENALKGSDIGRQITIQEKNETKLQIKSLKGSTDKSHSAAQGGSSQQRTSSNQFRNSGDKYRHQFKQSQAELQLKADKIKKSCILCHIYQNKSIQRDGGLMIKKLANFTTDSCVFNMKNSFSEAKKDIGDLSQAFSKELAFKFNEQELTYFEKLAHMLTPKTKVKKHMQNAFEYMKSHVCEAASSMPVQVVGKVREFQFSFQWDSFDEEFKPYDLDKTCLSDVQWNFSNLDRSDRIHMVYNALQDTLIMQEQKASKIASVKNIKANNHDLNVTSQEQVIIEDAPSTFLHINENRSQMDYLISKNQQTVTGQSDYKNNFQAASNPDILVHNRDLDEQLVKLPLGREIKNVDISSALDAPNGHSQMHIYNNNTSAADINSTEKAKVTNEDNIAIKSNKTSSGQMGQIETPEVNTKTAAQFAATASFTEAKKDDKSRSQDEGETDDRKRKDSGLYQAEITEGIQLFNNDIDNEPQQDSAISSTNKHHNEGGGLKKHVTRPARKLEAEEDVGVICELPSQGIIINNDDDDDKNNSNADAGESSEITVTGLQQKSGLNNVDKSGRVSSLTQQIDLQKSEDALTTKLMSLKRDKNISEANIAQRQSMEFSKNNSNNVDNPQHKYYNSQETVIGEVSKKDSSNENAQTYKSQAIIHAEYNLEQENQNNQEEYTDDIILDNQRGRSDISHSDEFVDKTVILGSKNNQIGSVAQSQSQASRSFSLHTKKILGGNRNTDLAPNRIGSSSIGSYADQDQDQNNLLKQKTQLTRKTIGAYVVQKRKNQTSSYSETIQTDKSPADYVNYVSIKVTENQCGTIEGSSMPNEMTEGTQEDVVGISGVIDYASSQEAINVADSIEKQSTSQNIKF